MHSLPIISVPPTELPSHWEPHFCSLINSSCNFFPEPLLPPTSCSHFRAFVHVFLSAVFLVFLAPSHPLSQIKCHFLRELCSFYLTRCIPTAPFIYSTCSLFAFSLLALLLMLPKTRRATRAEILFYSLLNFQCQPQCLAHR